MEFEISTILHMIRKPNSIIFLLFIQNNSQVKNKVKTCLPPSMLSSSSIVHVQGFPAPKIFSKQQMSLFELSSGCSCHVFSYYFAQFLFLKRVKWVYLGVRTCELFLCFAPFVFLGSIVFIFCCLCFTSPVSLTGSYTRLSEMSAIFVFTAKNNSTSFPGLLG